MWHKRRSIGSHIFDAFNVILMIVMIFIMLYPFLYVFSVSISDIKQVRENRVTLFPRGWDTIGYRLVFLGGEIPRAFLNSIYYTAVQTALMLIYVSMAAYPLSRKRLKGKGVITLLFALTMFLPAGMVPSYLLIQRLGMMNTVWALVLPALPAVWYIVIVRTNFQGLPDSLMDSAYIDGTGEFRVLFQIVLPLSKAILATIGLFTAVGMWNNFFGPLLYLSNQKKYPLAIVLRRVTIQRVHTQTAQGRMADGTGLGLEDLRDTGLYRKIEMATVIIAVSPILVVYPFVQKYFVKGVLIGSLKG